MSEARENRSFGLSACPVCGTIRSDSALPRCENCGSDLSSLKTLDDFITSLLLEARNDIRNRKYVEARTKLDIASEMDETTAQIAKLIGTEIIENENRFDEALANYEHALKEGIAGDRWGINLQQKIEKMKKMLELELASKEHYNIALHRSREGFFAEAREELFKAADLAPYLPEIYLLAAKIDLSLGAETSMYDNIIRFKQLRPDDPRGEQMMKELEKRKHSSRLQSEQVFFAICFIIFAVATLVLITVVK